MDEFHIVPLGVEFTNSYHDHVNSTSPELGDKSPYEMFEFYYGKEILDLLGVHKIPANEIILKPELLKRR